MCSEKEKFDEFLNKFSNPLKVLREVCKKEKLEVLKEVIILKMSLKKFKKIWWKKQSKCLRETINTSN